MIKLSRSRINQLRVQVGLKPRDIHEYVSKWDTYSISPMYRRICRKHSNNTRNIISIIILITLYLLECCVH